MTSCSTLFGGASFVMDQQQLAVKSEKDLEELVEAGSVDTT